MARRWIDVTLEAIRSDYVRPPVQARTLFHVSLAMYDAWALYDREASPFFIGKTFPAFREGADPFINVFDGITIPEDTKAAREMAISYAAYQVLKHRYLQSRSPNRPLALFENLMHELGYDPNFSDTDYHSGAPAALGNYIGVSIVNSWEGDGSNERANYAIQNYYPVNQPLYMDRPGNPRCQDPNRWQPLKLRKAFDQANHLVPGLQKFICPEWGEVYPFALPTQARKTQVSDGTAFYFYHDPGPPPRLDTILSDEPSEFYKWNFALVAAWASHHDASDGVRWDISPGHMGNVTEYPKTKEDIKKFYNFYDGGDNGKGHKFNPKTGKPYAPNVVARGDYTRALTQFWSDGPESETPPGHWYKILNHVNDHPQLVRKFNGKGKEVDALEWDVKGYFLLGGALHDAAVAAWGLKGVYDGIRPISAIRYMADRGQSSDPTAQHYHPAGLPIVPKLIEVVKPGDPLAGSNNEHLYKVKLFSWKGHSFVKDPTRDMAGAGWILAENWEPYQKKTFVTPPFGGYISGHSTFSSAAAQAIALYTGDPFFPGGLGTFVIDTTNALFADFERGPTHTIVLQYATYKDAADQCSLSRIWGGIHPPFDDMPGRVIGERVGTDAFLLAQKTFYQDSDRDGHYSYDDSDDSNPQIF